MTTITETNITQQLDLTQFQIVFPDDANQVVEYPAKSAFPETGRDRRLYLAQDNGTLWRWTGDYYQQTADLPPVFSQTPPAHPYTGQRWTTPFDLTTYEWFAGAWVEKPTNH
jgi:hypothetical protein